MKEYIVFLAKWTFTDRPITNTRASGPTRFHKQPLPRTPFPTCLYSFTAKADSRVRVESITLSYCPTVITPAPAPCHNTSGQSELTHGKALCEHQTSFSSSPKFLGSHSTAFVELAPCLPQRKILGHVTSLLTTCQPRPSALVYRHLRKIQAPLYSTLGEREM
ncbi:hypothetical protein BU26DRAFT_188334 [Trematosphaeria pertusa]|uniref:Uncharacterized protein n=1 Tax=Trematosphaeria pertusa TaxID=390896 RepID=A0A6A6HRV6_9PLEO|nr:uncharacterized protein BU26DRAFT_188334 [Trematosphaeria pertusa]KAF2240731.1 hypothetical protein BU26DRAFT_188334 [Trematosphaeria pertusa]